MRLLGLLGERGGSFPALSRKFIVSCCARGTQLKDEIPSTEHAKMNFRSAKNSVHFARDYLICSKHHTNSSM